MNLGKVFQLAFSFAGGRKDPHLAEALKCVALYSDYRVVAQTPRVGIILQAEPLDDLQAPVLLPVEDLQAVVVKAPLTGVLSLQSCLVFQAEDIDGQYEVPLRDPAGFPPVYEVPEQWTRLLPEERDSMLAVVKSAAKGRADPEVLRGIQILGDRIEATDRQRVAFAHVEVPGVTLPAQLPIEVFAKWPKGDVKVGQTQGRIWFRVAGQLRWATRLEGPGNQYPDLARMAAPTWGSSTAIVQAKAFALAVEQGKKASRLQTLALEFHPAEVVIRAYTQVPGEEGTAVTEYEAKVPSKPWPGEPWPDHPVRVLLDVKNLVEAAKKAITPNLRLVFRDHRAPVYLESGLLTEIIWPRI